MSASLTPERFARVRAIFEAALDRPPAERRAYAAGACAEDAALLDEVEAMLAAEEHTNTLLPRGGAARVSSSATHEEGRFPAGTVLAGRYRILGLLGRGGMGEVYKAFDLILDQMVALKFLSPAHISESALARFRNEVRIARQVSHPNVCRVYDLGMVEGLHFLSMEFIDGEDLGSLLRRIGRLPQDKAMEFTRKICAGLGAAHDRGVLHRDLKPANIMIDGRGQPRITDFGLAGLAAEIPLSDIRSGTPAYMSPEQRAGKEVTLRSDIYSLGLVLHEMFTGKQRKDSQSSPSEIVQDLDPAIERLILRCLEEDPKRRPASGLRVAMSLPGGDPIAAALAAGETPSPEMIAASQEKEGFSIPVAVSCFLIVVALVVGGFLFEQKFGYLATAPLEKPPDAMAERIRTFLTQLGYGGQDAETFGYICCDRSQDDKLLRLSPEVRARTLRNHRLAGTRFVYRRGKPQGIEITNAADRIILEPQPGLIQVAYDPAGRLLYLAANASSSEAVDGDPDWSALFKEAGLDIARFTPIEPPALPPPVAFDVQAAWRGAYSDDLPEPVEIRAAAWRGKPAFFQAGQTPSFDILRTASRTDLLALGLAVLLAIPAWRNWRSNRVDRRGALWLMAAPLMAVVAVARLVPASSIVAVGFVILSLYVGTEPYARRYWPDSLVSWNRLVRGQFRNSLVASHILAGIAAGTFLGITRFWIRTMFSPLPDQTQLAVLLETGSDFYAIAWALATVYAVTALALFILARLMISRTWIADTAAIVAFMVFFVESSVDAWPLSWVVMALSLLRTLLWIFLWRRLGFLALLVIWQLSTVYAGVVNISTGWLATESMLVNAVPILLALWALWVILTDKRSTGITTETA